MNLYAYVHNDPLSFTDPTGEAAQGIGGVIIVAAVACAKSPACRKAVAKGVKKVSDKISRKSKGSADGPRAGKRHTRGAIKKAKENNAAKNGGKVKCESCGRETTEPTRRTAGSKVNPREAQGDHIHPKSKGGDGATVKDQSNIDIKCAECNLKKSDNLQ